jgi:tyrosyl-tRNA synthetase
VVEAAVAAGLVKSKGDARRLIKTGGLYCNDVRVVGQMAAV